MMSIYGGMKLLNITKTLNHQ